MNTDQTFVVRSAASPTAAALNITAPPKPVDINKPVPYVPNQLARHTSAVCSANEDEPSIEDAEQQSPSVDNDASIISRHDDVDRDSLDGDGAMQYQQSLDSSMDDTLNRDPSVEEDDDDDDDGLDVAMAVHSLYPDDPDICWSDDGDTINGSSECRKGYLSSPTHIVSPQNDAIDVNVVQSPSHTRSETVRICSDYIDAEDDNGDHEADDAVDDAVDDAADATAEQKSMELELDRKWMDIFEQQKKESEQQVQQLQKQLQALAKQLHAKAELHQRKLATVRPEAPLQAMLSSRTQRISISNTLPLRHLRDETQTFEYGHKFDPGFTQNSVTLTADGDHEPPMVRMFDIASTPYMYSYGGGGQSSQHNVFSIKSKTAWPHTSMTSMPSQMSKMSQTVTCTLSSADFEEDSKEESFSFSPTLTPTCADTAAVQKKKDVKSRSADKTSMLLWFLKCACFDWKISCKTPRTTDMDGKKKRKTKDHGNHREGQTEISLP